MQFRVEIAGIEINIERPRIEIPHFAKLEVKVRPPSDVHVNRICVWPGKNLVFRDQAPVCEGESLVCWFKPTGLGSASIQLEVISQEPECDNDLETDRGRKLVYMSVVSPAAVSCRQRLAPV